MADWFNREVVTDPEMLEESGIVIETWTDKDGVRHFEARRVEKDGEL